MNWTSWGAFFHMGGYGLYVWGAYGVTAFVLALEIVAVRRRAARARADLQHGVAE